MRQYSQAQLAMLGLGVGSMFSETFQKYAGIAQLGLSMLFLKFSRDDERQADALGAEYASRAGFDANHMANMFVTLSGSTRAPTAAAPPGWFSTHPNPPDRIAAIRRDAQVSAGKAGGGCGVRHQPRAGTSAASRARLRRRPPPGLRRGADFHHPSSRSSSRCPRAGR